MSTEKTFTAVRSSSRSNAGVAPERLGFPSTSKKSSKKTTVTPRALSSAEAYYFEHAAEVLPKLLEEQEEFLEQCRTEQKEAETALVPYGNKDETELDPSELDGFKLDKAKRHNAVFIAPQIQERILAIKYVQKLKQDEQNEVSVSSNLNADEREKHLERHATMEIEPSRRQSGGSVASSKSVTTQIRLAGKRAQLKLKREFFAERDKVSEAYEECQYLLTQEVDLGKRQELQNSLESVETKIKRITQSYEDQKQLIEEEMELDILEAEADDEQDLSDDDFPPTIPDRVQQSETAKRPEQKQAEFSHPPPRQESESYRVHLDTSSQANVPCFPQPLPQVFTPPYYPAYFSMPSSPAEKRLPEFDGNPTHWGGFKSAFDETTVKYKIDNRENMTRLQNCLKGRAKDSVQHLMSNSLNVKKIMEVLERRYGRPEFILDYLVEQVRQFKNIDLNKPQSVVDFGTLVEALVTNVQNYQKDGYMQDRQLVLALTRKLPGDLHDQWCGWLIDDERRNENLEDFAKWTDLQVRKAERRIVPDFFSDTTGKKKGKAVIGAAVENIENRKGCIYCISKEREKTNHSFVKCQSFEKLSGEDKLKFVREKDLCFRCLKGSHKIDKCSSKEKCKIEGCRGRHHTFLHETARRSQPNPPKEIEKAKEEEKELLSRLEKLGDSGGKESSNHLSQVNLINSASLPIIPVQLRGPNGKKKTFALLDSGATCSILEKKLADELGLQGNDFSFDVSLLGEVQRKEESTLVDFEMSGDFRHAPCFKLKEVRTIPKLGITGVSVDVEELKRSYPHLKGMQLQSYHNAIPRLIVGFDNSRLFAARRILEKDDSDSPCAYKSLLGWYVCESRHAKDSCNLVMQIHTDDELHQEMKEFFALENFGVKPKVGVRRSREDDRALELMKNHTKKVDANRYETCLLWKDESCAMPGSYHMALRRLQGMERKMDKDEEFAELAIQKFKEYKEKGFLKPKETPVDPNGKRWYLPWFFAFHPNKKPRLVFDASAKSYGRSLNDYLLPGPDFLEPLPAVLLRFRRHQYAVTGDIKEMFHQVQLRKVDRPSQTILFRGIDRKSSPEELEMNVLFFGSASSPSSALFVKNENALSFKEDFPQIVEPSIRDCYMDDFLSGADSEDEAVKLQKTVTFIHSSAGFLVLKWNSNSEKVFNKIPSEIRAERKNFVQLEEKSELECEKTLGMLWDPVADEFVFKFTPKKRHESLFSLEKIPTKREVTSLIMSVFDPLGFLAPCKIVGLIVLQSIWKSGIGWDDQISQEIFSQWKKWISELKGVSDLRIPRRIIFSSISLAENIQLHVFVDASSEAYAAVSYLRFSIGGSTSKSFVMGKSRVAPIKQITIPRMELQAALLGIRLADIVKEAYDSMKISSTVYWSDSRTVLSWIRNPKLKLNIFVGNRIGEILEKSNSSDWRWVPTSMNPADNATRMSKSSLSVWLHGQDFLLEGEENWPKESKEETEENVIEEINTITEEKDSSSPQFELPNISRFSNFLRLLRATAYVYVAVRRFKRKGKKDEGYRHENITLEDLEKAKKYWTLKAQEESFEKEICTLQAGKEISKSSRLLCLSPQINEEGILVVNGRINNAVVSFSIKNPPILDSKHPYVKFMVNWYHTKSQHYGQERIVNEIRKEAWVIGCRTAVRKCSHECLICRKGKCTPIPPKMGQLPLARVEAGNPVFFQCSVDYFGPLQIKNKRSIEKRWGVIFSCMATRAVHFELAQSLSTSDFINVFVRFANLRGKPAHLWSDNGTNFIGAEREIREKLEELNQEKIQTSLQICGTQWHFLPPASPHMGGSHERLIQDAKRILYKMLKEQHPHEDVLRTFLTEVTAILNSRPITVASSSPEDPRCLTPNDILNIRPVVGHVIPGKYEKNDLLRKSWMQVQWLSRHFWERWSAEYLPWLAERQKWHKKTTPLKVGDLVLVLEDNAPRNSWKMGRITEVFPAKDGQVRFVEVRIAHVDPSDTKKIVKYSDLRRPVVKICLLVSEEETEVSGGRMSTSTI